jgi:hypothetical protein
MVAFVVAEVKGGGMKPKRKAFVIGLMAVFAVTLAGAAVWAGGSPEGGGSGTPPKGVAIQSDAAGTKLTGVLFIEFQNVRSCQGLVADEARLVLRLRQGNDLGAFTDIIDCTNSPDACRTTMPNTGCGPDPITLIDLNKVTEIQAALTAAVEDQILDFFFGTTSLAITVTRLGECATVDDPPQPASLFSRFVVCDVSLAVK